MSVCGVALALVGLFLQFDGVIGACDDGTCVNGYYYRLYACRSMVSNCCPSGCSFPGGSCSSSGCEAGTSDPLLSIGENATLTSYGRSYSLQATSDGLFISGVKRDSLSLSTSAMNCQISSVCTTTYSCAHSICSEEQCSATNCPKDGDPVEKSGSHESGSGSKSGAIAAGVLVPLLVIGAGALGFFFYRKRKSGTANLQLNVRSSHLMDEPPGKECCIQQHCPKGPDSVIVVGSEWVEI